LHVYDSGEGGKEGGDIVSTLSLIFSSLYIQDTRKSKGQKKVINHGQGGVGGGGGGGIHVINYKCRRALSLDI